MKKILFTLFLLGIAIMAGCAPVQKQALKITPSSIDFGTVDPSSGIKKAQLVVQNTGSRTLKIMNVATSCGCTEGSVGEKTLAPGEKTPLDVRFDPSMHIGEAAGAIYHLIYVQTDDPILEETEVEMRAFIQSKP